MPEPEASWPDDVVVRIGGAGLCRTDLHIIDGWFADVIPAELPVVLGHENAGWVHAVGVRKAVPALGPGSFAVAVAVCTGGLG